MLCYLAQCDSLTATCNENRRTSLLEWKWRDRCACSLKMTSMQGEWFGSPNTLNDPNRFSQRFLPFSGRGGEERTPRGGEPVCPPARSGAKGPPAPDSSDRDPRPDEPASLDGDRRC